MTASLTPAQLSLIRQLARAGSKEVLRANQQDVLLLERVGLIARGKGNYLLTDCGRRFIRIELGEAQKRPSNGTESG